MYPLILGFTSQIKSILYILCLKNKKQGGISEYGSEIKLCEDNSEGMWEHSKKIRQGSYDLSFFENTELLLEFFVLLSGVEDRPVFTSDYSFMSFWCYSIKCLNNPVYDYKENKISPMYFLSLWLYTAWNHDKFTEMTFLNTQSINFLRVLIKLIITWYFIPPSLPTSLFQVL